MNLKSSLIGIVLLAIIVYWQWPESKEDALAYESVEACIRADEHDAGVCRKEFENAKKLFTELADDMTTPNGIRSRSTEMSKIVRQ